MSEIQEPISALKNKRITELTTLQKITGLEEILLDNGDSTYKTTIDALLGYIVQKINISLDGERYIFHEEYDPEYNYKNTGLLVDLVYYEGSTYYCKRDSVVGITPEDDKVNWVYFCRGGSGTGGSGLVLSNIQFMNLETGEVLNTGLLQFMDLETGEVLNTESIQFMDLETGEVI